MVVRITKSQPETSERQRQTPQRMVQSLDLILSSTFLSRLKLAFVSDCKGFGCEREPFTELIEPTQVSLRALGLLELAYCQTFLARLLPDF